MNVREGWLSTGRRRQQKEVDVQLAVDMLSHAFQKNMTKAILVAGDRDFKPLVQSLVQFGTYVNLVSDPLSRAKELARAADVATSIDIAMLCDWMKMDEDDERNSHFPNRTIHRTPVLAMKSMFPDSTLIRQGKLSYKGQDKDAAIYGCDQRRRHCITVALKPAEHHLFTDRDWGKLEKYVGLLLGEITWT